MVTGTTWDDTAATLDVTYYYWVRATNAGGDSGLSVPNTGFATGPPPPAPTNVMASDGTHPDKVAVSWNASAGATGYHIYRGVYPDPGTFVTTVSGTSWDDTDTTPGVVYHYWIRASNPGGASPFSQWDTGFVIAYADTPTGISASDGTFFNKVQVTWSAAVNAEQYKIYRATLPNTAFFLRGTVPASATSWDDNQANTGLRYRYRVTAWTATGGESTPSATDDGYEGLPLPANLRATDGLSQGEVRITWEAAAGATDYEVHRGTAADGSDAVLVGTTSGTNYTDTSGTAGAHYHYFVKAKAGAVTSEIGAGDAGHGTAGPPFRPDGSIGKTAASLLGNNLYNDSGLGQTQTLASKKLKKVKFEGMIENDGESPDYLMALGNRGSRTFRVHYFLNGANVSAGILAGLDAGRFEPGSGRAIKIVVKPSKKLLNRRTRKIKRKKFTAMVTVTSKMAPSRADTMGGVTKTK